MVFKIKTALLFTLKQGPALTIKGMALPLHVTQSLLSLLIQDGERRRSIFLLCITVLYLCTGWKVTYCLQ